jgi:hypothetical protein
LVRPSCLLLLAGYVFPETNNFAVGLLHVLCPDLLQLKADLPHVEAAAVVDLAPSKEQTKGADESKPSDKLTDTTTRLKVLRVRLEKVKSLLAAAQAPRPAPAAVAPAAPGAEGEDGSHQDAVAAEPEKEKEKPAGELNYIKTITVCLLSHVLNLTFFLSIGIRCTRGGCSEGLGPAAAAEQRELPRPGYPVLLRGQTQVGHLPVARNIR